MNATTVGLSEDDLSVCSALVVDSNPTSRAILTSQLRDLGMKNVRQTSRTAEARAQLEVRTFDFVLCEMHFAEEETSGQDLLDDLRRNQLLPFSTVFIMITGEATYAKVAEAAESALDGYLLKPHKASHLIERLRVARIRKVSLQPIFDAIDAQDFEGAAMQCLERFASKGKFWLYAARVGAELLLRLERFDDAQMLYQAVVEAKTLPWARLGIARAQLESGQIAMATTTLEKLIGEDPNFADAYDVLGRAHFELGQFDKSLATYALAARLTPASVSRIQNAAMMTYYSGDHAEAERLLTRTTRMGLDSKMFDCQTLVLLAFTRLELEDRKGLHVCSDDFGRLVERDPNNHRVVRLAHFVTVINLLMQREHARVVHEAQLLAGLITTADFDFESAGNMLALLAQMHLHGVGFDAAAQVVQTIGIRFCSNRSVTEMLVSCAQAHPPYAELVRTAQSQAMSLAEAAMAQSMAGNPAAAIEALLQHGRATLNVRLIDNAAQLLQKHATLLAARDDLRATVRELKNLAGAGNRKLTLGNQRRQAGGLVLRTSHRSGTPLPAAPVPEPD